MITLYSLEWIHNGKSCSRLQLPLQLAWAITIHKSQGLTLDKAIIDIGEKEFSTGLTYVALSRVHSIKDMLIYKPFCYPTMISICKLPG